MVVHDRILAVISVFTCLSEWTYYRQVYRTDYAIETPPEVQLQWPQPDIIVAEKNALFPTDRTSEETQVSEELVDWKGHKLAVPGQPDLNGCRSNNSHLREKISIKRNVKANRFKEKSKTQIWIIIKTLLPFQRMSSEG